jgi:hypothetical protein
MNWKLNWSKFVRWKSYIGRKEEVNSRVAATGTLLISIKKQMGGKERIAFLSRKMVRNLYILQKS